MPLSPEFSQGRSQHPINESLRNKLVGQTGWATREQQGQTETPRNFTSALPINNEALARLSMEKRQEAEQQLRELPLLLPQLSPQETADVWNEASKIQNVEEIYSGNNKERSPIYLKVLQMLSALLLLGILAGSFTKTAEAASVIPTVTPTPESTEAPLPTITPSPSATEAEPESITPKATKKPVSSPTITPYPTVTHTPTPTPELTPTPEILVDWAVISVTVANLRSEPSLDSDIVTTANKGDLFQLAPQEDQPKDKTWAAVLRPDGSVAYLHSSVFTVEEYPQPSSGTGGSVLETTPDSNSADASNIEISKQQESIERHLPSNFREFYEAKGGVVAWNTEHMLFQVTMPVNGKQITYLLFPEASAEKVSGDFVSDNDTPDLEHGLFYLDKQGTVSHTFTEAGGKQITQTFHILTSPELPSSADSDLWDETFVPSEVTATFGDKFVENSDKTVEILRTMYGLPANENFNIYLLFSGQHMNEYNENPEVLTPYETKSLVSGGNDYQSIVLRLDDDRKAAIFFTDLDLFGKQYLINAEDVENGKQYFGPDLAIHMLQRLITDLHSKEDSKKFLDPGYYDTFSSEMIQKLYDLEEVYGQFSMNINFPQETLDAYIKSLRD
jgi:hypothetical protein